MAVLSMRACWCLGFTVVLGVMVHAPGSAPASPLEDTTMNGAVFTGPAHPHATSVYLNPGALGLAVQGWHFYFGGSLRLDRIDIARQRIVDPAVGLEPGPEVHALPIAPGGTIAAVNVGSKVSVGVAFGLPLSEQLISNQPALGYHVLDGHHRQWAGALAVAFQVNRRLQVGTGLWLTSTSLELSFLRDTALERGEIDATDCAGTTVCGIENPDAAEQYDLVVGSPDSLATQNLALSIGAIYQLAQDWWLGLSYQSPSGLQSPIALTGTARVTPSPRDARRGAMPSAGQAAVSYKLPQSLSLGVRGPIAGDYELVASMRWQAWSRQRLLDVRLFGRDLAPDVPEWYPRYRGLRDVFLAEAGIEGREGRRARLGARARIETGATAPEAVSPVQIDGWNLTGVIGSEFRLTDSLALSLSYGITWFPTRNVDDSLFDPRDRVACIDSGYALDECTAAAAGRALPTAAGTYDRLSHALRVSLRFSPL